MSRETPAHATIWVADWIGRRDPVSRRPVWEAVETFNLAAMNFPTLGEKTAMIEKAFAETHRATRFGRRLALVYHGAVPAAGVGKPPG